MWPQDAGKRIRQCRIPVILLVAYGMKAPFPGMCVFSSIQPPQCSILSWFNLGRYCYVPYIPIFGKVDDISGDIYPMLGELGGGYGSVELNYKLPHTQTCKLKCYPKLVHYLKACNIGVDLPTTVKGYRSHVGALEQMLVELNSDPGRYLCAFHFELAISGTLLSMMQCYDQVRTYRIDDESVPENVIVMKRTPVDEYITFLTNALAVAKDAGLCHERTSSTRQFYNFINIILLVLNETYKVYYYAIRYGSCSIRVYQLFTTIFHKINSNYSY